MQWDNFQNISIIYPDPDTEQNMLSAISQTEALVIELDKIRSKASSIIEERYSLATEDANDILQAFKPPK